MPQYTPPIRDTRFVLDHVVGLQSHANVAGFAAATPETVDAVLEEGAAGSSPRCCSRSTIRAIRKAARATTTVR